ncbi:hypothetical protein BGX34_006228 [Mortierella sp. NVP85]|nr:hypothetical protein BGX34_006228 [Mortierella sp. NVP85]
MQKKLTGLETFKLTCNTPQRLFYDHARLIAAVLSSPKTEDDARPLVRVLSSVLSPRSTSTFYVAATSSPRDAIYPEMGLPGLPPSTLPAHVTSSPLMNRPPNCGLKMLCLENVEFEPQGWEVILKALDLTVLESLSFRGTNFDRPELRLLLDRIPDDNSFVPFRDLNLAHTKLAQNEERDSGNARHTLMRMLKEKSKYLKISGLDLDDRLERPDSWLFRLYFLCECGFHTLKGQDTIHKIHSTSHRGYSLKRPKEFFDRYGLYVLTMMKMIKYGTTTPGYVVPPLAQSNTVLTIEKSRGHPYFTDENMSKVVNGIIMYLEQITRVFDDNANAASQWIIDSTDLEELRSYVNVPKDDRFHGDLYWLTTQELHCSWVCGAHHPQLAPLRIDRSHSQRVAPQHISRSSPPPVAPKHIGRSHSQRITISEHKTNPQHTDVLEANAGTDADTNVGLTAKSPTSDHTVEDTVEHENTSLHNTAESLSTIQQTNGSVDQSPEACDPAADSGVDSTLLGHIKLEESYIEAIMEGQATLISIVQSIKHVSESSLEEISEDKNQVSLLEELVQALALGIQEGGQVLSMDQEMEQYVLEMQQEILHTQQPGIDHMVLAQKNTQDAAALAFAALEHPVPRMFIVIPRFPILLRGAQLFQFDPSVFRLFFLCEHGHQSTTKGRSTSTIHLAKHEGYELQNAEEFFRVYTPYIVSMIHILKNGIASPGLSVPNMSHLALAGINEVQDILGLANNTIQSLMNDTISYIRNRGYGASMDRMSDKVALDVLESTDLQSILKYLKRRRTKLKQTLGNLRQIITSDGSVKWVCTEHYIEKPHEATEKHLDDEDTDEEYEDNTGDKTNLLGIQHGEPVETVASYTPQEQRWIVREKAVVALHGRTKRDDTALQTLITAVADKHESVREAAVRVLRNPSMASRTALDVVLSAVNDNHWNVQEAAMRVLGEQPQLSKEVFLTLVHAAESEHQYVNGAAMDVLIKHASSDSVLLGLAEILHGDSIREKMIAMEVLATQVKLPEIAVEALINTLQDDDRRIRDSAIFALQCQTELSESAMEILSEKLQDEALEVREAAIRVLGSQISVHESVTPILIASLQDESDVIQEAAGQAFHRQYNLEQSTIQDLIFLLSHEHASTRKATANALRGKVNLSGTAILALVETLSDENPGVRMSVVQALGGHVHQTQLVIDALYLMLEDDYPGVRGAAALSLGCKASLPESVIQALIRRLADKDVGVQEMTIQALGGQAADSSAVVEVLTELLESEDQVIRDSTVHALSNDVQLSDAAIWKMTADLLNKRRHIRMATVELLRKHIKWSNAAVEALTCAIIDRDMDIRAMAVSALEDKSYLPESVVLILVAILTDDDWEVRRAAVRILGKQVNSSNAAVEVLITSLRDPNKDVRIDAERALCNLMQISDSTVQSMEDALRDDDSGIRKSALHVLSDHIQSCEAAALAALNAIRDTHPSVSFAARRALSENGLPESTALQVFKKLKDGDGLTTHAVVSVLSELPNMSGSAVHLLIQKLNNKAMDVRKAGAREFGKHFKLSEAGVQALIDAC